MFDPPFRHRAITGFFGQYGRADNDHAFGLKKGKQGRIHARIKPQLLLVLYNGLF